MTVEVDVGSPRLVLLAGDCEGGRIASAIDDGLRLDVSGSDGWSASADWDFLVGGTCAGANTGGPAIDVTRLFEVGKHSVKLTITDECGGSISTTPLFLVSQPAA